MKSVVIAVMAAAGVLVAGHASADEKLATSKGCMACHKVDAKVVGPSYKDVAAKYKGKKSADDLAKSIKAGGSGKWGPVAMPAQAALSDADAKTLATWILSK